MSTPTGEENPPVSEMLATHTLAHRVITQHNTPLEIFDARSLALLREWVCNNTPENRHALLRERDMLDMPGEDLGTRANKKGDLAGYVLARYGSPNDKGTLTAQEVEQLKEWFENGGGN